MRNCTKDEKRVIRAWHAAARALHPGKVPHINKFYQALRKLTHYHGSRKRAFAALARKYL